MDDPRLRALRAAIEKMEARKEGKPVQTRLPLSGNGRKVESRPVQPKQILPPDLDDFDRDDIPELTRRLARMLGEGWSMEAWNEEREDKNRATLLGPNGWRINVVDGSSAYRSTRDRNRVEFDSAHVIQKWWDYRRTGEVAPWISVNKYRPIVQIIAEIKRRLLPDYATWFQEIAEAHTERMDRVNNELDAFTRLMEVSHGRMPDWARYNAESRQGQLEVQFGRYAEYNWPNGKVCDLYHGRLKMELHDLTVDEAEAVIELLIKLRSK
jgi:hypothetical protein